MCRVCLCDVEELPESRLVKLECACVGVYVHETCAEKWLRTKGSNVCEVCRESTQFDVPESFVGRLLRRAGVASERDRGDDARVPANRDDRARAVPTAATDRFYDSGFIRYRSRCVTYDLVRARRARKKKTGLTRGYEYQ